jgi:starvation-inducible outer membrane lipoprotein
MGLRCPPPGTTTLKAIKDDPRRYEGKIVTVYGEVTEQMSLVAVSYFKLYDRSDEEIFVVTRRTLPTVGSKVRVRGKVQQFSILNWHGLAMFELPK